jgi:hypothetical protein
MLTEYIEDLVVPLRYSGPLLNILILAATSWTGQGGHGGGASAYVEWSCVSVPNMSAEASACLSSPNSKCLSQTALPLHSGPTHWIWFTGLLGYRKPGHQMEVCSAYQQTGPCGRRRLTASLRYMDENLARQQGDSRTRGDPRGRILSTTPRSAKPTGVARGQGSNRVFSS